MTPKMITDKHNRPDAREGAPLRFGDAIKGEHEQQPGELLDDREATRRADKQRYEAQKGEAADYPGDSGKQAAARLKDEPNTQTAVGKEVVKEAAIGTREK